MNYFTGEETWTSPTRNKILNKHMFNMKNLFIYIYKYHHSNIHHSCRGGSSYRLLVASIDVPLMFCSPLLLRLATEFSHLEAGEALRFHRFGEAEKHGKQGFWEGVPYFSPPTFRWPTNGNCSLEFAHIDIITPWKMKLSIWCIMDCTWKKTPW